MKTYCRIHIFLIAIFATLLLIANTAAEVTPNTSVEPQSDIGLKGIGGQFGFVAPEVYGSTTLFGVILDLGAIPVQTSALRLEGVASYWSASQIKDLSGNESLTLFDYREDKGVNTLEVNLTAKYYFPTRRGNLLPFVGGGLSFARSSYSEETTYSVGGSDSDFFSTSDSDYVNVFGAEVPTTINFGVHGVGGFDIPVGNSLTFRGELRYQSSGLNSLQVVGGLVFPFGSSEPPPKPQPAVSQREAEAAVPAREVVP